MGALTSRSSKPPRRPRIIEPMRIERSRIAYAVLAGMIASLFGSIPTGYWLGKLLRGIDLRDHGSKSTGATNVLRTLGKAPAVATLLVDLLKGVAAIAFARLLYPLPTVIAAKPAVVFLGTWLPWAIMGVALLAILGHSRSIFIQFMGGKSAATGLGVLLAASWQVGLGVAITFVVVLVVSRIASLSSILVAALRPLWPDGPFSRGQSWQPSLDVRLSSSPRPSDSQT